MAFKSFTCVTQTTSNAIPPEGWSSTGDALLIANNADVTPLFYMPCDPDLSFFYGAAPVQLGMTQAEFYELWPLVLLILITGFCIKQVLLVFKKK